jgi:hypothetical protein
MQRKTLFLCSGKQTAEQQKSAWQRTVGLMFLNASSGVHSGPVIAIAAAAEQIATLGADATLLSWGLTGTLREPTPCPSCDNLALSPDGRYLLGGGGGMNVALLFDLSKAGPGQPASITVRR